MKKMAKRWWLCGILMVAGACQPGTGTREPDAYEGCATDELWRVFDDAERGLAQGNAETAPAFEPPITEGAQLAATSPPRFTWQLTPETSGNPNGNATCPQCSTCGGIGTQHLPEVTGEAFDLQFRIDGAVVYRVVTTLQRWDPPAVEWARWNGRSVEVEAVRLTLADNAILAGPYRAARPITFRVGN